MARSRRGRCSGGCKSPTTRTKYFRDAMMIQTQTLAVDNDTRTKLLVISSLIHQHRNDPERVKALIAEHDEIMKRAPTATYDQGEESKWA